LFDQRSDDAANFGAIGAIIGHELTHGFDDQGRKFDGAGNLRDWWTAEDGKEFDKKEQCVADEYSGFDVHVETSGRRVIAIATESGKRIYSPWFLAPLPPGQ
jgi:putative endopeptidase